jgi:response regulator RpfG family c-di-GMP phosphodiesterase
MERVTPQNPETGAAQEGRTPTVLVVDDDSRVVELLQITLGGRGFRVLTAGDGEEAIESIHANRPDFLVLDVRLPRRSGFDVCETVRKDPDYRQLPIILISGNTATESRLQGLRVGADDYLTKPFSPRELLLKMQRILDRNRDQELLALKTEVLEEEVRRQRDRLREIHTDFQNHLSRMSAILERIQDLNRHRVITEILDGLILTTVGILDFDAVALLALEDGHLRPRVHRGVRLRDPRTLVIDPSSATARILEESSHAMATEDLALRPDCRKEVGILSASGLLWSVGIQVDGKLRGILCVGERADRQPLDRFDLRLVEALAGSVGTALANTEVFDRTQTAFLQTITSLLMVFESRYPWLFGHSERVCKWALLIGKAVGLDQPSLDYLSAAALLHNIGAMERNESLLREAVLLSPTERKMRLTEASQTVGRLLSSVAHEEIVQTLRHQAEYWEGSGVPDGLKGEQIPMGSRILSIANAYDALQHERPHRAAYTAEQARELIQARAGTQFDPQVVGSFLRCLETAEVETE